eukprot:GHVQ01009519.1.p1 GENE.GHVQ01009519.1~~GHVQ01009519.1.p1  ORF type:complete len:1053 (-),score=227.27 GHVQ01009519.1:1723-4881(-)
MTTQKRMSRVSISTSRSTRQGEVPLSATGAETWSSHMLCLLLSLHDSLNRASTTTTTTTSLCDNSEQYITVTGIHAVQVCHKKTQQHVKETSLTLVGGAVRPAVSLQRTTRWHLSHVLYNVASCLKALLCYYIIMSYYHHVDESTLCILAQALPPTAVDINIATTDSNLSVSVTSVLEAELLQVRWDPLSFYPSQFVEVYIVPTEIVADTLDYVMSLSHEDFAPAKKRPGSVELRRLQIAGSGSLATSSSSSSSLSSISYERLVPAFRPLLLATDIAPQDVETLSLFLSYLDPQMVEYVLTNMSPQGNDLITSSLALPSMDLRPYLADPQILHEYVVNNRTDEAKYHQTITALASLLDNPSAAAKLVNSLPPDMALSLVDTSAELLLASGGDLKDLARTLRRATAAAALQEALKTFGSLGNAFQSGKPPMLSEMTNKQEKDDIVEKVREELVVIKPPAAINAIEEETVEDIFVDKELEGNGGGDERWRTRIVKDVKTHVYLKELSLEGAFKNAIFKVLVKNDGSFAMLPRVADAVEEYESVKVPESMDKIEDTKSSHLESTNIQSTTTSTSKPPVTFIATHGVTTSAVDMTVQSSSSLDLSEDPDLSLQLKFDRLPSAGGGPAGGRPAGGRPANVPLDLAQAALAVAALVAEVDPKTLTSPLPKLPEVKFPSMSELPILPPLKIFGNTHDTIHQESPDSISEDSKPLSSTDTDGVHDASESTAESSSPRYGILHLPESLPRRPDRIFRKTSDSSPPTSLEPSRLFGRNSNAVVRRRALQQMNQLDSGGEEDEPEGLLYSWSVLLVAPHAPWRPLPPTLYVSSPIHVVRDPTAQYPVRLLAPLPIVYRANGKRSVGGEEGSVGEAQFVTVEETHVGGYAVVPVRWKLFTGGKVYVSLWRMEYGTAKLVERVVTGREELKMLITADDVCQGEYFASVSLYYNAEYVTAKSDRFRIGGGDELCEGRKSGSAGQNVDSSGTGISAVVVGVIIAVVLLCVAIICLFIKVIVHRQRERRRQMYGKEQLSIGKASSPEAPSPKAPSPSQFGSKVTAAQV